ncbi:hypothetical protein NMY22_g10752 [Coprinellus aureogranulatus]|nr:hypothetical protein NMY22_g10752 [Coprinellus aureogranulatus]
MRVEWEWDLKGSLYSDATSSGAVAAPGGSDKLAGSINGRLQSHSSGSDDNLNVQLHRREKVHPGTTTRASVSTERKAKGLVALSTFTSTPVDDDPTVWCSDSVFRSLTTLRRVSLQDAVGGQAPPRAFDL